MPFYTRRATRSLLPLLATALLASACGDDDGPTDDADTGTDVAPDSDAGNGDATTDAGDVTTDAQPDMAEDIADTGVPEACSIEGATDTRIVAGDYFLTVSVEPLGGLLIFFRVEIYADEDEILLFNVYSLSADLSWESDEPVATACNLPIEGDTFVVAIDMITIPPQGTTTGVEVSVFDFVFDATLQSTTGVCGGVSGFLPLLGFDLETSTFAAVPLGEETSPPNASCEPPEVITYDPIETCPTIAVGNVEMTSAELERNFNFFAPEDIGSDPLPLVFLFHGLGDNAEGVIGYTDFDDLVETERFLLVVPEGANNNDGSQVFPIDWNILAAQYSNDNQDLVFFDDMLKCAGEQFPIDLDRIYVTGMSGGGLMTTFLGLHRTDVIAALAPMSGGYLQAWPSEVTTRPWLVGWGGENDIAVGTNFNDAANNLIDNLLSDDIPVIACNHNEEHTWPLAMTPAIYAFLSAFELGVDADPFAGGLPDVFPDYCEIVE